MQYVPRQCVAPRSTAGRHGAIAWLGAASGRAGHSGRSADPAARITADLSVIAQRAAATIVGWRPCHVGALLLVARTPRRRADAAAPIAAHLPHITGVRATHQARRLGDRRKLRCEVRARARPARSPCAPGVAARRSSVLARRGSYRLAASSFATSSGGHSIRARALTRQRLSG